MDWARRMIGISSGGGGGGGDATPPPPRDGYAERANALARAQSMQLAGLKDELNETEEDLTAAVVKKDTVTVRAKLLRKRQLETQIRVLAGKLENVRVQSSTAGAAEANLEQARLTKEAAETIQALNREAEGVDIVGAVEDLREGVDDTAAYSDMLAEPITGGLDTMDLDAEMAQLMDHQDEMAALEALSGAMPVPKGGGARADVVVASKKGTGN